MAKITARGDREFARWKGDNGDTLVLTERRRLLRRSADSGYTLVSQSMNPEMVEAWIARNGGGFTRVATRGR